MNAIIRKIVTVVEETHLEMGQKVAPPTRRAAAIAVIENPFAGRYVEDLSPLIEIGEELGDLLSKKAIAALGIDGAKAHSYGKAAAVGENGELEHAAAILHPKMGAPVRKVLSKGAALRLLGETVVVGAAAQALPASQALHGSAIENLMHVL